MLYIYIWQEKSLGNKKLHSESAMEQVVPETSIHHFFVNLVSMLYHEYAVFVIWNTTKTNNKIARDCEVGLKTTHWIRKNVHKAWASTKKSSKVTQNHIRKKFCCNRPVKIVGELHCSFINLNGKISWTRKLQIKLIWIIVVS